MKRDLLAALRAGEALSGAEQLRLTMHLSLPGILSQLSSVIMQYIDASMVGRLGAGEAASIGLVASTTWLCSGFATSFVNGFSIQTAHAIGARDMTKARRLIRQGYVVCIAISLLITLVTAAVSGALPRWLGGEAAICPDATRYLLIYALALPVSESVALSGGMLQVSGNMRAPSLCQVMMCCLDVVFNAVLIFPSIRCGPITVRGAGLGVAGAALGTALAMTAAAIALNTILWRQRFLELYKKEPFRMVTEELRTAARLSAPMAAERFIMGGAQVMLTHIIAPLGTVAIAAHSFAVTVESVCYMPGYGVGNAASVLVGQSIGARRRDLAYRLGLVTVGVGMAAMTLTGILMYVFAAPMMSLLSPDSAVVALGAAVLRIEAFCEPFFAASIVAAAVLCAAGDTLRPTLLNFISMWCVRIPLAALLAGRFGLRGVWIAMCLELTVRGVLFLTRLLRKKWLPSAERKDSTDGSIPLR